MITLHSIYLQNFRSVGEDGITIHFDQKKHTLYVGDNGAGKSTGPLHALTYNWFNKAYGVKDKLASLVNSINKKNCVTVSEFTTKGKRYKVTRGMKPSIFDIEWLNGEKWVRILDEAERGKYQDVLLDIIGFDMGILHNNILMGLDNFKSFVSLSVPERRVMVEQYLDLTVFSDMNDIAKEKMKDITRRSELNQKQREFANNDRESQLRIIETMENAEKDRLSELEADKKELEDSRVPIEDDINDKRSEIDTQETEIENLGDPAGELRKFERIQNNLNQITPLRGEIEDSKIDVDNLTLKSSDTNTALNTAKTAVLDFAYDPNEHDKIFGMIGQFKNKIDVLKKDNAHLDSIDLCPTCRQHMQEDHRSDLVGSNNTKLDQLKSGLDKLNDKLKAAVVNRDKYNELVKVKNQAKNDFNTAYALLDAAKKSHASLEIKYDNLKKLCGDYDINDVNTEITANQRDLHVKNELTEELNKLKLDLNGLTTALKSIARQVVSIESKIKSINEKPNDNIAEENTKLKDIEVHQKDLSDQADLLDREFNVAEIALNSLKDNGIKADIISKYLPKFQEYANYYLNKMELYLGFEMDERFNIKFTAPDRKGQTSNSLSNGQKRRLDIAIILSWAKIAGLKNTVETNFLIIDEILDAISSDGVSEIIDMLKVEYGDKDIAITTQRGAEFQEYFDHGAYFELSGGFTQMTLIED